MIRVLAFVLVLLPQLALALTPQEQSTMTSCYLSDAAARGKDANGMVIELLNFIFLARSAQKTQLTNVMQRCRAAIQAHQDTFTADTNAGLATLNQDGANTDAALSAVSTLP